MTQYLRDLKSVQNYYLYLEDQYNEALLNQLKKDRK